MEIHHRMKFFSRDLGEVPMLLQEFSLGDVVFNVTWQCMEARQSAEIAARHHNVSVVTQLPAFLCARLVRMFKPFGHSRFPSSCMPQRFGRADIRLNGEIC